MDRRWRTWALAGAAGMTGLLALHFWVPPAGAEFIICPFRRFTGLPCPGCGMTRAFAHLAKGQWSAAVRDHPLAPLLAAEMCLGWAAWGLPAAGRLRAAAVARMDRLALWHGLALILVWVSRMATGTLPG